MERETILEMVLDFQGVWFGMLFIHQSGIFLDASRIQESKGSKYVWTSTLENSYK